MRDAVETRWRQAPWAVEVAGLAKAFGPSPALRGVDLTLPKGAILTLFGPNGAGKTTLLKILATLLRPTAGEARIGGFDLRRERDGVRRLIGLLAHGHHLYEDLTALENLRFAVALHGESPEPTVLEEALARAGLDGQAGVRVREFSAGMKRRLALARLRLARPRLLLLDEPFDGLDQAAMKGLEEFLLAFKAEGGSALLATHSLGRGYAVADRIAILVGGRLVAHESRETLSLEGLQRLYAAATEG